MYSLLMFSGELACVEEESSSDCVAKASVHVLTRADALPVDSFADATDPYLEGYIQALIDVHYYEYQVVVVVKDHKVLLSHLPDNDLLSKSIIAFVEDLPGVRRVEVIEMTKQEMESRKAYVEQPRVSGVWFPQTTVLFAPLIADPRQPMNSAAIRVGDGVCGDKCAAVSLGDDFPVFRWMNVWPFHGDLQLGIEAGIWSVFNYSHIPSRPQPELCELVNTDFLVGLPVTYAFDKWSFRVRLYHISSHLGDEYLCNHRGAVDTRVNPSMEAMDVFASYQFSSGLRGYFGPGVVLHSDRSFHIKPLYVEYGMELRMLGTRFDYHRLYGTPFFALHCEHWEQRHWDLDVTAKLGYELSKLQGVGRKMRIYVDYHHGFSYEGQFFNKRTDYGEWGISWGF